MSTILYKDHSRFWEENEYIYPVLSRRSQGISIGINLTPWGQCTFRCLYCQIQKVELRPEHRVDLDRLRSELEKCVAFCVSGEIFRHPHFAGVSPRHQRINDIAFSGDGEPTLSPVFYDAVKIAAEYRTGAMKLVLITNATRLADAATQPALDLLDAHHGEIWAKLDAGTEAFYQRVNQSHVPFADVLSGLTFAAKRRPLILQTLFFQIDGEAPDDNEVAAYIGRIRDLIQSGGKIRYIQLHSVCRMPAFSCCSPIPKERLIPYAERIYHETGVEVRIF
ncbi:MAG: radical SAM protein [Planctomycetia bacterium]|nr:radical SAM protein [Planctomycetia bacterium]